MPYSLARGLQAAIYQVYHQAQGILGAHGLGISTVDPALVRFFPKSDDLRDTINKLRKTLGVLDEYRTDHARTNYRKALQTTKRTNPGDWYLQWELAYRR